MDPRVARTRATVLRTATDLLVDGGPSAVTVEAIVARSGVAKSTIYRHWETRDDVLLEVIESCAPRISPPEASLLFEDSLRALVAEIRRTLNDPDWARVLPALLALRHQEHGIAALEQRLEKRQERAMEVVLERGLAEGRLHGDVDLDRATAVIVGPLLFAALMGKPEVDEDFCENVVDLFLQTHATPRSTG